PRVRAGRAVARLGRTQRVVGELDGRRALWTPPSQRVRGVGVALDVDDLAVLGVDQLATAHRAVGTHAAEDLRFLDFQRCSRGLDGGEIESLARDGDARGRRAPEL